MKQRSWMASWEAVFGIVLLVSATAWSGPARFVTLSDTALWFGGIVLGTGLLRDLWALWVTRPQPGEREVAMCAESMVGVAAIVAGLIVLLIPVSQGTLVRSGQVLAGLGGAFLFSAWVHDLVVVRRGKRWVWMRHPDHGSFVVHLLQGRSTACMTGGSEDDARTIERTT